MILTAALSAAGRPITQYLGVVLGEAISGMDFAKGFTAGLTSFFGGPSDSCGAELLNAQTQAWRRCPSGRPGWAPAPLWALTWTMKSWAPAAGC